MGVIGLFSYLKRKYPSAFNEKVMQLDDIYVDLNASLHPASDISPIPEEIGRIVLEVGQEYNRIYGARVHFHTDGVPHMGKTRHQRLRRFLYPPITVKDIGDGNLSTWTPAMLTPGTDVLYRIDKYIIDNMKNYPGVYSYSPSTEPGEGEHKLIRDIKLLPTSNKVGIVSKDGDVLLLGMGLEDRNVIVLRHYDEDKNNNSFKADDFIWHVSCPDLRQAILSKSRLSSIWDFIIATFLIGNDFVYSIPECSDLYSAIPRILSFRMKLYDKNKKMIIWKSLFTLIRKLSLPEKERKNQTKGQRRPRIPDKWVGQIEDASIFENLYYATYSPYPIDKYLLVQQWVITIEWIFRYYHDGMDTASRSWQFNAPIAPTLSTISEVGMSAVKNLDIAVKQVPPLSPTQALTAALPPWLWSLLPSKARQEVQAINEYYPYSFNMNEALEAPVIPTIPYNVVKNNISI
jgi:5'-3' exonuclease